MRQLHKQAFIGGILLTVSIFIVSLVTMMASDAHAIQSTVDLGSASPFAILAGTPDITDAGNASVIRGNVGLSPATGAGIGLLCSQVTGTIYSVDATGPLPCRITNGPLMVTAKNDLTTAYTNAANRIPVTTVPAELGGTTLVAGVYNSASTTFGITAGAGALVLDGKNDPSSVFIFEAAFEGNGLSVGSGSTVSLVNGAQACNVFWRVDSASIDTTATFIGSVLALNSISVANGATINGRLLARNGAVTLINDTITASICTGNDSAGNTPALPNTGIFAKSNVILAIVAGITLVISIALTIAIRNKRLI